MNERPARFDVEALRALAGDKVFARGEAYHRDGRVEILAIEGGRVLALVIGTEDYRIELARGGEAIIGDCSCPAFEDWGFCKHLVATALEADALTDEAEAEVTGALTRIRDYLRRQDVDGLTSMIVALAERHPAVFRELDEAARGVPGDTDRPATS